MAMVEVQLFGKFTLRRHQSQHYGLHSHKAMELFCYLLLFRERAHHRDYLADTLWGNSVTPGSRQSLRKALWQLNTALKPILGSSCEELILADEEWIRVNPDYDIWVDVDEFKRIYSSLRCVPDHQMDAQYFQAGMSGVGLYQGDLLQGWYQDWCHYERERLKGNYCDLLGKLVDYCENIGDLDTAIENSKRLLDIDRSNEHAYFHLMRLYYLKGDRISAIRQFEACRQVIMQEYHLDPDVSMQDIYNQIINGKPEHLIAKGQMLSETSSASILAALAQLKDLISTESSLIEMLLKEIQRLG
jgi:two-component SAPR family response regulator